ncbi:MAG: PDZ domain-containing protein [Deltaproteobacteria bacterium]|nr:PDZ domain-containing protein [Deltaproteobacteria bacterium]
MTKMTEETNLTCKKHFNLWVAFIFGMAITLTGIVLFDKLFFDSTQTRTGIGTSASLILTAGEPVPYLGVQAIDLDEAIIKTLNLRSNDGVLVGRVIKGSPAEEAGILRGDVILKFDRQKVKDVASFKDIVSNTSVGDRVKVGLVRDASRESLYVVIGTTPLSSALLTADAPTMLGNVGITVSPLTTSFSQQYGVQDGVQGVGVVAVAPGSKADTAGLQSGDVITEVNNEDVTDISSFIGALSSSSSALLDVVRGTDQSYISLSNISSVSVTPGANPGGGLRYGATPTGGIPFTTDDDDDEEEGGYQGKPELLPPQSTRTAGAPDMCKCLYCGTTLVHPVGVPCTTIKCPNCGNFMVSSNSSLLNVSGKPETIPPMGNPDDTVQSAYTIVALPIAGQPTAGMPTAGMPTAGMPTAGMPTAGMPTAGMPTAGMPTAGMPTAGMPSAGQPTAGQPTTGVLIAGGSSGGSSGGQQQGRTDVCVCPVCGATVAHPAGVQCLDLKCPNCGSQLVSGTALIKTSSKPETIPPMGSPTAGTKTAGSVM